MVKDGIVKIFSSIEASYENLDYLSQIVTITDEDARFIVESIRNEHFLYVDEVKRLISTSPSFPFGKKLIHLNSLGNNSLIKIQEYLYSASILKNLKGFKEIEKFGWKMAEKAANENLSLAEKILSLRIINLSRVSPNLEKQSHKVILQKLLNSENTLFWDVPISSLFIENEVIPDTIIIQSTLDTLREKMDGFLWSCETSKDFDLLISQFVILDKLEYLVPEDFSRLFQIHVRSVDISNYGSDAIYQALYYASDPAMWKTIPKLWTSPSIKNKELQGFRQTFFFSDLPEFYPVYATGAETLPTSVPIIDQEEYLADNFLSLVGEKVISEEIEFLLFLYIENQFADYELAKRKIREIVQKNNFDPQGDVYYISALSDIL